MFEDILPEDPSMYDKMRPPKKDGNPTTVYFHVTVMGLDSIDETSMVNTLNLFLTLIIRSSQINTNIVVILLKLE